ncbi:hypothetical protein ASC75_05040 [Aminobacter sp. DSM 101952]|uniref:hypothetical protein n=1 Tax=Aminobacter sp. DSM 101952 TaxID=2735891 RepID=UPI0006F894DF|nr:hypothetical protein [Aminobacter sp. DSM 101952]KQU73027.1 hypothetical protein ASC75_05040 [Aminobacter sp. DSM 101952]
MGNAIELAASLIFGPILLGLLVFALTYPIGQIIVGAQHRMAVQLWWTWVLGFGAAMAIYMVSGRSLF